MQVSLMCLRCGALLLQHTCSLVDLAEDIWSRREDQFQLLRVERVPAFWKKLGLQQAKPLTLGPRFKLCLCVFWGKTWRRRSSKLQLKPTLSRALSQGLQNALSRNLGARVQSPREPTSRIKPHEDSIEPDCGRATTSARLSCVVL